MGIFLQHSPNHLSSVPLVLKTSSGNVSPQFHCIYDDAFTTCRRDFKFNSIWQTKAKSNWNVPTIKIDLPPQQQPVPASSTTPPTVVQFDLNAPPNVEIPVNAHMLPSEFQHEWNNPVNDVGIDYVVSNSNNLDSTV